MGADFLPLIDGRAASGASDRLIVTMMDGQDMWPTLRHGSLLILGRPGYAGETLYSLPVGGVHSSNIRRLTACASECTLSTDGNPAARQTCTPQEFLAANPRPVVGALVPFDHDFQLWLCRQHERTAYVHR